MFQFEGYLIGAFRFNSMSEIIFFSSAESGLSAGFLG